VSEIWTILRQDLNEENLKVGFSTYIL
jgi:hypothetical protein